MGGIYVKEVLVFMCDGCRVCGEDCNQFFREFCRVLRWLNVICVIFSPWMLRALGSLSFMLVESDQGGGGGGGG